MKKSFPHVRLLALSLCIQTAYAQTAAPAKPAEGEGNKQLDTVVVTGIRASLEDAARKKRSADQIKDVITAEDIGKLPDANIAEAIQRVTGVQIGRDAAGEGNGFQVRGLSSNNVTIDGASALSTNPENRGVSLQNLSSQLYSGVEVVKSPSAADVEGSLGATVKLITRKPLDTPPNTLSLRVEGQYPQLRGHNQLDSSVTGLASSRWNINGHRLGALLTVAFDDYSSRADTYFTSGWAPLVVGNVAGSQVVSTAVGTAGKLPVSYPGLPNNVIYRPGNIQLQQLDFSRQRRGATGTVQWSPNSEWLFTATVDHSLFDSKQTNARNVFNLGDTKTYFAPAANADGALLNYTRDPIEGETGPQSFSFLLASRVGVKPQPGTTATADLLRGGFGMQFSHNEQNSLRLKSEYTGERFDANVSVNVSRGRNYENGGVFNLGLPDTRLAPASVRLSEMLDWDMRDSKNPPSFRWTLPAGYTLSDPSNWAVNNYTLSTQLRTTGEDELMGNFIWHLDAGPVKELRVGARHARTTFRGDSLAENNFSENGFRLVSSVPQLAGFFRPMEQPVFANHPVASQLSWFQGAELSPDQYTELTTSLRAQNVPTSDLIYSFGVREKRSAIYGQADFDGEAMGLRYRGNAGVRYVRQQSHILGTRLIPPSTVQPLEFDKSFSSWLPAANVAVELSKQDIVRVAAAKVVAFADPVQIIPNVKLPVGFSAQARSGNPDLPPLTTKQLDLSYERYWGRSNLFSAALFFKKSSAFTIDQTVTVSDVDRDNNGVVDSADAFQLTTPGLGQPRTIRGAELGLQAMMDFLPGWLSGFGVAANYTKTISRQAGTNRNFITGEELTLPKLSPNSYNLAVFYERGGFSGRVAYNLRDAYYLNVNQGLNTFQDRYGQVDVSASYQFNKWISVSASVINANDADRVQYANIRQIIANYQNSGRRITLALVLKNF